MKYHRPEARAILDEFGAHGGQKIFFVAARFPRCVYCGVYRTEGRRRYVRQLGERYQRLLRRLIRAGKILRRSTGSSYWDKCSLRGWLSDSR